MLKAYLAHRASADENFLAFTRRQELIMLLQLAQLRSPLTRLSIQGDGGVDGLEQFLLAKRFRQKLNGPRFHRTDR